MLQVPVFSGNLVTDGGAALGGGTGPTAPFFILIDSEVIKSCCNGGRFSGNVLTVSGGRGQRRNDRCSTRRRSVKCTS